MTTPTPKLLAIDWQQAERLMNGNLQKARKLLKQLLAELPQALVAIQQALNSQDDKILFEKVHKLHGACCYYSVPALRSSQEARICFT